MLLGGEEKGEVRQRQRVREGDVGVECEGGEESGLELKKEEAVAFERAF